MLWQISRRPELAFRTLPGAVWSMLDDAQDGFMMGLSYLRVTVALEQMSGAD